MFNIIISTKSVFFIFHFWGRVAAWQLCSWLNLWSKTFDVSFKLSLFPHIKLAIRVLVVGYLIWMWLNLQSFSYCILGVNKQGNHILREVWVLLACCKHQRYSVSTMYLWDYVAICTSATNSSHSFQIWICISQVIESFYSSWNTLMWGMCCNYISK